MVVLKNGRSEFSGAPSELMDNAVLEKVYDKPFVFVEHPLTGNKLIVPEGNAE